MNTNTKFTALAAKLCLAAGAAFSLSAPLPAYACSGCGCNLDTDEGSAGSRNGSGWSVDERVDYINQNHLMTGGKNAPPQDPTTGTEVQQKTVTVFYTTTLDYKADNGWGVNVAVPFQYRYHTTYNTGSWNQSNSEWNELSDIKVLGRYTGFTESQNYGVVLGLKLPTGATNLKFSGAAAGQTVDPGLQPGTGTWDLLAGLTQTGKINEKLTWFAQEMWQ